MTGDLVTERGLRLPAAALEEQFARGSGPGGQHRNTTDSAVVLVVSLDELTGPGAERVRAKLGDRLRVRVADSRSQWRNRAMARDRLIDLIDGAAVPVRRRRRTRPGRGAVERRLDAKRRNALRKADRRSRWDDEG